MGLRPENLLSAYATADDVIPPKMSNLVCICFRVDFLSFFKKSEGYWQKKILLKRGTDF